MKNSSNILISDLNPANFLYTKTYGIAPNNTTITVNYTVGGGPEDNVFSDSITRILNKSVLIDEFGLDSTLYSRVYNSLAVTNPNPATGGKIGEDVEEIRQNALAHFASQNRAVTKEDYMLRAYTLPAKYGSIAKVYVVKDSELTYNGISEKNMSQNNLGITYYISGYDADGKLIPINDTTKENLKTYLDQYRMLTDGITIRDAYVINIAIEFEIISLQNQNGNQVILKCINRLKEYFDTSKWQINQPIILSNIYTELDRIEGVQTVVDLKVVNKYN